MLRSVVAVSIAFLVACGSGTTLSPPAPPKLTATARAALVYISNSYENSVYVYSYPKLKLVETLTGLNQPEGECVDATGDVWVTEFMSSQIVEFGHGATTPKATLSDPNNFPYACAVDPHSGDLAAVNFAHNPVAGGLSIYTRAKGAPHVYTDNSLYIPFFDAYDAKGTLYLDGFRGFYYPYFALVSFRNGTFTNIELNHTVIAPGALAVVGSRVEVGDAWRYAHSVYGFTVKGLKGRLVGTTTLLGTDVVQEFAVVGTSLIAANVDQKQGSGMVFSYPKGGSPKRIFGAKQLQVGPIGVVVSR